MKELRKYDKKEYPGRMHMPVEDRLMAYLFEMDLDEYVNLKQDFKLWKDVVDVEGEE